MRLIPPVENDSPQSHQSNDGTEQEDNGSNCVFFNAAMLKMLFSSGSGSRGSEDDKEQAENSDSRASCPHLNRMQRRIEHFRRGLWDYARGEYDTRVCDNEEISSGSEVPPTESDSATKHYKIGKRRFFDQDEASMTNNTTDDWSERWIRGEANWSNGRITTKPSRKRISSASASFSYKMRNQDSTTDPSSGIHPRSIIFPPVNQPHYFPPIDRTEFFHSVERCRQKGESILVDQCMPLLKEIRLQNEAGCRMLKRGIVFRACNAFQPYQAYYSSGGHQIVLCCNHINGEQELIGALKHELIHAYDACRFHNSLRLCRSRACSEVRAYHMDRSCEQLWSSDYKSYDECVRSLAVESIQEACPDTAIEDVDKVYESCIKDVSPFLESEAFDPRTLGTDELHEVGTRSFVDDEFL